MTILPALVALLQDAASPFPLPSTYGEGLLIVGLAAALGVLYKDKLRDQQKLDKADEKREEQLTTLRAATEAMNQMTAGSAAIKDGFAALTFASNGNREEILREIRALRGGPPA